MPNVLAFGRERNWKICNGGIYSIKTPNRKNEPFVHIDLGSISENLFEAELFGYAKGAFTDAKTDKAGKIENADGGTVFLRRNWKFNASTSTKIT